MRGFKSFASAQRFCRSFDALRNFLHFQTRHNQYVPAKRRGCLTTVVPPLRSLFSKLDGVHYAVPHLLLAAQTTE